MSKKVNRNVPNLRFSEFKGDWKLTKLKKLGAVISGLTYSPSDVRKAGLLVLRSSNVLNGKIALDDCVFVDVGVPPESLSKENDILICVRNGSTNLIGKNALIPSNIPLSTHGAFMVIFRSDINNLLFQIFQTDIYKRQVYQDLGARINSINSNRLREYKFWIPENKDEQEKIARFLGAVDTRLTQLRRKQELLQTYKRGVMQKLFSQQIRFKSEEGKPFPDWEKKKLGEIASRQVKKNLDESITRVLTNSAVQGVVDQQDYFDKDIANADNLAGYYIIEKGDYVYNPRISTSAPVGPIHKNKIGLGVMSPLYTVFRFKTEENAFYEQLFKTSVWHKYMCSVANYGARYDRMNITTSDFMALPLPYPISEEQQKIVDFLTAIDKKIEAVAQQIDLTEQFKKGLLQKMFV